MPSNTPEYIARNYKKYWGNTKALRDRVKRVQARRIMEKKWLVKKWDGKEVHHKKGIVWWNWNDNLAVVTLKYNRRDGQKKATKSQLARNKLKRITNK